MVPAVRHGFSVTIQTAYRLPGSVAYAEAELQAPDSRYVKYTFPGGVGFLGPQLWPEMWPHCSLGLLENGWGDLNTCTRFG